MKQKFLQILTWTYKRTASCSTSRDQREITYKRVSVKATYVCAEDSRFDGTERRCISETDADTKQGHRQDVLYAGSIIPKEARYCLQNRFSLDVSVSQFFPQCNKARQADKIVILPQLGAPRLLMFAV